MSKKKKWLVQTLILSAALNVALLGVFFYFIAWNHPLHFSFQPREREEVEKNQFGDAFLDRLYSLDFLQLVGLLRDETEVLHGYRVCDFAVAALSSFHNIDIARGVGRSILTKRKWQNRRGTLIFYPSLSSEDCVHLQEFITAERFPYRSEKLLELIECDGHDPELLNFFCHTSEFILLERLFSRSAVPCSKGNLLAMVREGGWEPLKNFYDQQKECSDFSDQTRQEVLIAYIQSGSKTAAYFLLITDLEFASTRPEDPLVLQMLQLLDTDTHEALQFFRAIADSPRSEEVCDLASQRQGTLRPVFRERPPAAPSPSMHVIQPGESLWLIARKYAVSVEYLMQVNHLHSTVIQPGATLTIPPED